MFLIVLLAIVGISVAIIVLDVIFGNPRTSHTYVFDEQRRTNELLQRDIRNKELGWYDKLNNK